MNKFSRHSQRLSWAVFFAAVLASYLILPEQVGEPGKQISRGAYIAMVLLTALPLPWLFTGGGLKWLRRDLSLLNVPHKDYWFAPSRAEASWQRVEALLLSAGWLCWLIFAGIHYHLLSSSHVGWPLMASGKVAWAVVGLATLTVAVLLYRGWWQWRVPKATLTAWKAQQAQALQSPSQAHAGSALKRPPRPPKAPGHGQPQ